MENNIKPQGCPSYLQEKFKEVVTDYWDVFCEDGLHRPIWGFLLQIDAGNNLYIGCKPHRYSPHESVVMKNMAKRLDENGVVEEDDGPWELFVVIASKPRQENVPWNEYQ